MRTPPLVPVAEPVALEAAIVPHPRPFMARLTVDGDQLSQVIEHVSNIEYVRWLDRAAELHSDALGWTRARLLEDGVMWFVARHEIDYVSECWRDDRLVVATWVRDMKRVRSWRDIVVFRDHGDRSIPLGEDDIVCRAATLWVLIDLSSRRPRAISKTMAAGFEPLDRVTPAASPGTSP